MVSAEALDASNLTAYARGCAILGTGGGGDIDVPLLQALQAVEEFGPVTIADLADLDDDALVMPCGGYGAPTVSIEKFDAGDEGSRLCEAVARLWGRPVDAIMAGEIGGGNGVTPVAWAAQAGLPLADADGMGRAFPLAHQVSMHVAGIPPRRSVVTDERGNVVVVDPADGSWLEPIVRAITVAFGGTAAGADHVMNAREARTASILGSVSTALAIGEALDEPEPVTAVLAATGGLPLLHGKVVDVDRRTTGGFARGRVTVEGIGDDLGRRAIVDVQNENLAVSDDEGTVLASVPDLITLIDDTSGDAVPTERLRYGQRVVIVGIACDPLWRTPAGLRVAGPAAFGYEHPYRPVEERR